MFRTFRDVIGSGVSASRDADHALREAGLRRSSLPLAHPAAGFHGGHVADYPVLRLSRPRGLRTR